MPTAILAMQMLCPSANHLSTLRLLLLSVRSRWHSPCLSCLPESGHSCNFTAPLLKLLPCMQAVRR